MIKTIQEELRTQVELISLAPTTDRLELEFGYAIGMIRAARIGKLISDKALNHYTDEVCSAHKERLDRLLEMYG